MISVIMPVYNAAGFLRESIESILNQTEKDFELIVVNDGSTDASEEIILSYDDPRIRYVKQENSGVASARNTGLEHAKGDFVLFHDSDDISLPMRFEILRRNFVAQSVGIVHSDMLLIDESAKPIGYWQSKNIEQARVLRFLLKIGTPYNNGSAMLRHEALRKVRHDVSLHLGSDTEMIVRVARDWRSIHIAEPLLFYRQHAQSLTKDIDYDVLAAHIRKFLHGYALEELVPEVGWEHGDASDNRAKASIIIALFLARRGMVPDAQKWADAADSLANAIDTKLFLKALVNLINKNYRVALQLLASCSMQDHIIENYLGETFALLGNAEQAYEHFMRALMLCPDYEEPVDNLKGLGGLMDFRLVDVSWMRFRVA